MYFFNRHTYLCGSMDKRKGLLDWIIKRFIDAACLIWSYFGINFFHFIFWIHVENSSSWLYRSLLLTTWLQIELEMNILKYDFTDSVRFCFAHENRFTKSCYSWRSTKSCTNSASKYTIRYLSPRLPNSVNFTWVYRKHYVRR